MKSLSFLFVLLLPVVGFSQQYYPLLADTTVWNAVIGGGLGGSTIPVSTLGDSTVNNVSYRLIRCSYGRALMREDTAQKKVYFKRKNNIGSVDTVEFVLYDFGLQQNDTILLHSIYLGDNVVSMPDTLGVYKVDTIYTMPTLAGLRRVFELSRTTPSVNARLNKTRWLEGVGEISCRKQLAPFQYFSWTAIYYTTYQDIADVKCVFRNGVEIYHDTSFTSFGGDTCYHKWSDAVKEVNSPSDIIIYPNPFANDLTIAPGLPFADNARVIIQNIFGQEVFSKAIENKESLQLTGLPGGVYYLKLVSGDKRVVRKIVKE